jgi:hypothetical protein
MDPEARGEQAVGSRGRPAALQVSQDCDAHLVPDVETSKLGCNALPGAAESSLATTVRGLDLAGLAVRGARALADHDDGEAKA